MRIFISSTWQDLQPEREAVEKALRRMQEAQFSGMEYFGSRPETPREASLAEVDRSDIYVGIFAHRYGSGITEAEYHRARKRGFRCLIYFKDDKAPVLPAHIEHDPRKAAKLEALKNELKEQHTVSTFDNPDQLATRVATDLINSLGELPPKPAPPVEPPRPVPWLGYFFVALLDLNLILVILLGWRSLGDRPAQLWYLGVVAATLGIGLEILVWGIVIQRKMSITDALRWLGTTRLWQVVIVVVTITLVLVNVPPIARPSTPTSTPATILQIKLDASVIQDEQTLIRDRDFVWIEAEVLGDGTPVPPGEFEYKWSFNPPDNQNQDKDWGKAQKVDYHLPHELEYQLLTVQVRGGGQQWSKSIHFTLEE